MNDLLKIFITYTVLCLILIGVGFIVKKFTWDFSPVSLRIDIDKLEKRIENLESK